LRVCVISPGDLDSTGGVERAAARLCGYSAGDTAYLVAMASRDAPTGQILYELRDCKSRIEGSLEDSVPGDPQESLA
jgi:hypothetical protein